MEGRISDQHVAELEVPLPRITMGIVQLNPSKRKFAMKKPYKMLTILAFFTTFSTQALGNDDLPAETWKCYGLFDFGEETVIVELTQEKISRDHTYGEGKVSAGGIIHTARFRINGLDRRWDFGSDFDYAFIIEPDGTGRYYDFSQVESGESTGPKETYKCTSS